MDGHSSHETDAQTHRNNTWCVCVCLLTGHEDGAILFGGRLLCLLLPRGVREEGREG